MSIIAPIVGTPGVRAATSAIHKAVFKGGITSFLPGGKLIDGTKSRDPSNTDLTTNLQAGLVMGKITASGLYAPSILGTTTVANAAGDVIVTVSAAVAVELNRRVGGSGTFKLTGPPAAAGIVNTQVVTYSAVNTTTGVITCSALGPAAILGSFVQPSDGSELPLTFLPDGWPTPVANLNGTVQSVIQMPLVPAEGFVDVTKIINYPTDASLIAWLKARLSAPGQGQYIYSDNF